MDPGFRQDDVAIYSDACPVQNVESLRNRFDATHIRSQHLGNRDRPIRVLLVLHHGDHAAADGNA